LPWNTVIDYNSSSESEGEFLTLSAGRLERYIFELAIGSFPVPSTAYFFGNAGSIPGRIFFD
jgi:hypothetical protein